MSKTRKQNYFETYNENLKREKKQKNLHRTLRVMKKVADQLNPDDSALVAKIVEGKVEWAELTKRVAENESLNEALQKLGIEKEFKNCADAIGTACKEIQGFLKKIEDNSKQAIKKADLYSRIDELAKDANKKAAKLKDKINELKAKKPPTSVDHAKNLAKVVVAAQRFAHVTQALHADVLSYTSASKSSEDFTFFLERQLAKRRLLQEELKLIYDAPRPELVVGETVYTRNKLTQLDQQQLDVLQKNVFNNPVIAKINTLSVKAYRSLLQEHLTELIKIIEKPENKRSKKDQENLINNKLILDIIIDENNKLRQHALLELTTHLEKEHVLRLLVEREELIKNCVMGKLLTLDDAEKVENNLAADQDQIKQIQQTRTTIRSILDSSVEKQTREFIDPARTQSFLDFARDPQIANLSEHAKRKALEIKHHQEGIIEAKITKKDKMVRAKSLMLVAAGCTVLGAVGAAVIGFTVVSAAFLAPILTPIILTLGFAAVVVGIAAERIQPGVTKELKNGFKHYYKKLKKHNVIAEQMITLKDDVRSDQSSFPQPSTQKLKSAVNVQLNQDEDELDQFLNHVPKKKNSDIDAKQILKKYLSSMNKKAQLTVKKAILDNSNLLDADDIVLAAKIANGEVEFSEVGKRIATNETAKKAFEQLGIWNEMKALIDGAAELGSKIERICAEIKSDQLTAERKQTALEELNKLVEGKISDSSNLKKKINELLPDPKVSVVDHAKNVATLAKCLKNIVYTGHAIRADIVSRQNTLRSIMDPTYWLERQLAKRKLLQNELKLIQEAKVRSGLVFEARDQQKLEQLTAEQLEDLQKNVFAVMRLSDIKALSIKEYRDLLQYKLSNLLEVYQKAQEHQANAEERELLKNNLAVFEFIIDKATGEMKHNALIALLSHLEKEHVMGLLEEREGLIKNCVIARLHELSLNEDQDKTSYHNLITSLQQSVETAANSKIYVSDQDKSRAESFLNFAKKPDESVIAAKNSQNEHQLDHKKIIDHALSVRNNYKSHLCLKLKVQEDKIAAKSMFFVSGVISFGSAACATVAALAGIAAIVAVAPALVAAAPILAGLAVGLAVTAAIVALSAEFLHPGTLKEMKNSFKHFSQKIKKHELLESVREDIKNPKHPTAISDDHHPLSVQETAAVKTGASPVVQVVTTMGAAASAMSSQDAPDLVGKFKTLFDQAEKSHFVFMLHFKTRKIAALLFRATTDDLKQIDEFLASKKHSKAFDQLNQLIEKEKSGFKKTLDNYASTVGQQPVGLNAVQLATQLSPDSAKHSNYKTSVVDSAAQIKEVASSISIDDLKKSKNMQKKSVFQTIKGLFFRDKEKKVVKKVERFYSRPSA